VTESNKLEYLQLFVQHRLVGAVAKQVEAFRSGLAVFFTAKVMPELHRCCTSADVQLLLCGTTAIDTVEWEQSAVYTGGLTAASEPAVWFWAIVHELKARDADKLGQLLHFCTGSSRCPISSRKHLQTSLSFGSTSVTHIWVVVPLLLGGNQGEKWYPR
jgi:hypothetical protein